MIKNSMSLKAKINNIAKEEKEDKLIQMRLEENQIKNEKKIKLDRAFLSSI